MTDKIQLEGFRVVGIEAMVSPMGSPGFDPEAIPTLWAKLMDKITAIYRHISMGRCMAWVS
jgi:hypothetical protein